MIINHEKKWIYISPPKTYSTSMCHLLTDGKYQNNIWGKSLEPNFEGIQIGNQHFPCAHEKIDDKYNDYMKFITVRNPFTRWISLWRHWRYGNNYNQGNQKKDNVGIEDFLKIVKLSKFDKSIDLGGNIFFTTNCAYWYKIGYIIIRVEDLKNNINELKLHKHEFKIPELNNFTRTTNKPINISHTKESIELVLDIANEDFELFGYDKNF